ncbi:peptidoglycan DD-metalloendopeptidase family protein [Streptomyces sp. TRM43335]|uniref:Peptidoglycan DD-metalloendopeptidase family protein n=1 Tax=Streptomyces taklimakanensis TaxID=2569853 RepID=A0A6G2BEL6_9ACTN|nr:peptidoglycan DD-metalloendopeptidase family protein [Streptomyces taklimakanensis]
MVNDRHPSGDPVPADPTADPTVDASYGPYGSPYDHQSYGHQAPQDTSYGYTTGTFDALGGAYGNDPLFGPLPGDAPEATASGATGPGIAPDTSWGGDTGAHPTYGGYDGGYDGHSTAAWAHVPTPSGHPQETAGYGWSETGTAHGTDAPAGAHPAYDGRSAGAWDDSGAYPAAHHPETHDAHPPADSDGYGFPTGEFSPGDFAEGFSTQEFSTQEFSAQELPAPDTEGFDARDDRHTADAPNATGSGTPDPSEGHDASHGSDGSDDPEAPGGPAGHHDRAEEPGAPVPPARSGGSRRRRSARPKRSALLTVAVPSVCVMGVTAVAAASVSGVGEDTDDTTQAAPDTSSVKISAANSKLDTQIAGLSDKAESFADRASRTQERIDLKERQEAERKRKAAEAARREALRPKFALPVAQHGLSAYYGQAGINWVSLHTGIDFPVAYGTPVMAATDGTVRTQSHSAYGNMVIVTAPDGTETWYCHLSSARIRSGSVKAGDIIAYSGNSGKSTGPHLHFEVRPGGGAAIDPLSWLRSKGLDPT